jgi:hypothetical protein
MGNELRVLWNARMQHATQYRTQTCFRFWSEGIRSRQPLVIRTCTSNITVKYEQNLPIHLRLNLTVVVPTRFLGSVQSSRSLVFEA